MFRYTDRGTRARTILSARELMLTDKPEKKKNRKYTSSVTNDEKGTETLVVAVMEQQINTKNILIIPEGKKIKNKCTDHL